MTDTRERVPLFGILKLPTPILVGPDLINVTIDISIAGRAGTARTPQLAWNSDPEPLPYLEQPIITEHLKKHLQHYAHERSESVWGRVNSWKTDRSGINSASLAGLLLEFSVDATEITYSEYLGDGLGHPKGEIIDQLHSEVDGWVDLLTTWLEVRVDQDLDPSQGLGIVTMPGYGLQLFTAHLSDGPSLPAHANRVNVTIQEAELVSKQVITDAARLAGEGVRPSDSHLLLRDARGAYRRHHYRRAAIDGGSAAELALATFNRTVTQVNTASSGATLGWYVGQSAIASSAGLAGSFQADVVKVRNDAIHQNRIPTSSETSQLLGLVKALLDRIEPLPL